MELAPGTAIGLVKIKTDAELRKKSSNTFAEQKRKSSNGKIGGSDRHQRYGSTDCEAMAPTSCIEQSIEDCDGPEPVQSFEPVFDLGHAAALARGGGVQPLRFRMTRRSSGRAANEYPRVACRRAQLRVLYFDN
jgi:hypothetical protein